MPCLVFAQGADGPLFLADDLLQLMIEPCERSIVLPDKGSPLRRGHIDELR